MAFVTNRIENCLLSIIVPLVGQVYLTTTTYIKTTTTMKDDANDINHQLKNNSGNILIRGANSNEVTGFCQKKCKGCTWAMLDYNLYKR